MVNGRKIDVQEKCELTPKGGGGGMRRGLVPGGPLGRCLGLLEAWNRKQTLIHSIPQNIHTIEYYDLL